MFAGTPASSVQVTTVSEEYFISSQRRKFHTVEYFSTFLKYHYIQTLTQLPMFSDKYFHKFKSLCAMADADSAMQIDELRRIILYRSVVPGHHDRIEAGCYISVRETNVY